MGRADQAVARTDSVRIKLAPDMVERLEKLAIAYGMPVSTMGAFALGQWVNQQEQNTANAQKGIEALLTRLGEQFDPSMIERAAVAAMPQIVQQMAKPSAVLDHVEASASK